MSLLGIHIRQPLPPFPSVLSFCPPLPNQTQHINSYIYMHTDTHPCPAWCFCRVTSTGGLEPCTLTLHPWPVTPVVCLCTGYCVRVFQGTWSSCWSGSNGTCWRNGPSSLSRESLCECPLHLTRTWSVCERYMSHRRWNKIPKVPNMSVTSGCSVGSVFDLKSGRFSLKLLKCWKYNNRAFRL